MSMKEIYPRARVIPAVLVMFDLSQTLQVARVFDRVRADRPLYLVGVSAGGTVYVASADATSIKAVRGEGGQSMVSALRNVHGLVVNYVEIVDLDIGADGGEGGGTSATEILAAGLQSVLLAAAQKPDVL